MMLTIDEIRNVIRDWIKDKPFVQRVHLVGSYARGEQTESSDVDLMIHFIDDLNEQQEYFKYHDNRDRWSEELRGVLSFKGEIQIHCYDLLCDEWRKSHLQRNIVLYDRNSSLNW